ncbi:hypothetical protein BSL78_03450 [Apostichopus japonicus]|uniref:Uncharacterized protein n=1 Tax=Stichopus japonicus TaxID=307972 RepID=A0A2G8LHC7_STIJA|nr:hypothetical protein BSL78_03450 [Apostichopus japonicus]
MAKAIVRDFKQLDNEDRDGYVLEFMAKTAKARAADIRDNKQKKFSDILKEYPRLIDTDGMVEQDFKILFPEACDALFMKWPSLEEKVLAYANKQVDWKDILHFHGNLSTNEKRSNIAIQVLPLLFPPGMSRTVDWHKHTRLSENMQQLQPFMLALGERECAEQVFVVVAGKNISCGNSLLKALDICLKVIYVWTWTTHGSVKTPGILFKNVFMDWVRERVRAPLPQVLPC